MILFALLFVSGRLLFDASGQAAQAPECRNGVVVPDHANEPGLLADCDTLWASKDTFLGTNLRTHPQFNWNASTAIGSWTGITVTNVTSTTPGTNVQRHGGRVTSISLRFRPVSTMYPVPLNGSLPAEFGNLTELTHLQIFGNSLTGSIPPELGNLANLTQLGLQSNSLTGPIPPELGNLANLTQLGLQSNSLTGPIPPELGNLSNLTQLGLQSNSLTGPIPSELGGISGLQRLLLGENRLSGEFPRWVENLGSLRHFSIQGNRLTGHLPLEYPFSSSVTHATIGGGGMFIGCLPSWATSNSAVVQGGWGLGLPNCGSPPGESVWVLDTVLAPPSPLDGATTTKLTLRATYTIPNAYVTATTTMGRLQFRSMSATAATGGAMTVSIARPATSTLPRLVGFDNRTGGTGIPAASELGRTTSINSSEFMCNTVSSTQTTVTSEGMQETRHVPPDPIAVVCEATLAKDIWVLDGSPTESLYVINVSLGTTSFDLTSTLTAAGITNRVITNTVGGTGGKNWPATELVVARDPFTPTPTPTATPTATPTHTPEPPTSTPTPTVTLTPTATVAPPTSTPAPPTSTPTHTPVPPTATPTRTPFSVPPPPPPSGPAPTPPPAPPPGPGATSTATPQAGTPQATAPPTRTPTPRATRPPAAGSYDIVATRTPTPTPPPTMTPTRTPVPTATATATPTTPTPPIALPVTGGPGISGGLLLMLALAGGLLLAAGSVILRARTAGGTP